MRPFVDTDLYIQGLQVCIPLNALIVRNIYIDRLYNCFSVKHIPVIIVNNVSPPTIIYLHFKYCDHQGISELSSNIILSPVATIVTKGISSD